MNPKSRFEAVWILVMFTSVPFEWLLIENRLIELVYVPFNTILSIWLAREIEQRIKQLFI
jgi:hypothetical protein